MTDTQRPWLLEETIPSDPVLGAELIAQILNRLSEEQWSEHDQFGVHLVVEEAVVNAIKHGNQDNRNKQVYLRAELNSDLLRVEVRDQGAGFRLEDIPDPTADDRLDCPNGRGLMLMRSFADHVAFLDGGRTVVLEKRKSAGD